MELISSDIATVGPSSSVYRHKLFRVLSSQLLELYSGDIVLLGGLPLCIPSPFVIVIVVMVAVVGSWSGH
ncbi:hypothetical protein Tco_0315825 [Tanacetum coccineum]